MTLPTDRAETARLRMELNRAEDRLVAAWIAACEQSDWRTGDHRVGSKWDLLFGYHEAMRGWLIARRDLHRWQALQAGELIAIEDR